MECRKFVVSRIADVQFHIPVLASLGATGVKFLDDGARAIAENGDLIGMVANKVNYTDFMHIYNLNLMNPMLLGGLFIGAMMTFVFCALTIKAVGRAASAK